MNERLMNMSRLTRLLIFAPLAIMGMLIFAWIGGELVKVLWNWLAPTLFGLRLITFWQALGLLTLCRILFGGFGLSGGGNHRSRRRMEGRIGERIRERVDERWSEMSPEQRARFRQDLHDRPGRTTPLDPNPTT